LGSGRNFHEAFRSGRESEERARDEAGSAECTRRRLGATRPRRADKSNAAHDSAPAITRACASSLGFVLVPPGLGATGPRRGGAVVVRCESLCPLPFRLCVCGGGMSLVLFLSSFLHPLANDELKLGLSLGAGWDGFSRPPLSFSRLCEGVTNGGARAGCAGLCAGVVVAGVAAWPARGSWLCSEPGLRSLPTPCLVGIARLLSSWSSLVGWTGASRPASDPPAGPVRVSSRRRNRPQLDRFSLV
jgi:hypothetical protein